MSEVDPAAVAAEVRRALAATNLDLGDPATRNAVITAISKGPDRRLTAAEKAVYALELRQAGASYREVARLVGWKSPGAAHKAVMKALVELKQEPAEELRTLSLARLDALLAGGLYRKARTGDLAAVDRVLSIMREQRRYVPGLEVPTNAEITGPGGGAIVVELAIPEPEHVRPVPEEELGSYPALALAPGPE